MKIRRPPRKDGLIIAFNRGKFNMINYWSMEFFIDQNHPIFNKQNVCLIVLLKHKKTKHYVLVANCHILFNINRGDIKLAQIGSIRRALYLLKISLEKQSKGKININIIWTGDLSTCPQSPIYEAICSGDFSQCAKYKKFEWSGQN